MTAPSSNEGGTVSKGTSLSESKEMVFTVYLRDFTVFHLKKGTWGWGRKESELSGSWSWRLVEIQHQFSADWKITQLPRQHRLPLLRYDRSSQPPVWRFLIPDLRGTAGINIELLLQEFITPAGNVHWWLPMGQRRQNIFSGPHLKLIKRQRRTSQSHLGISPSWSALWPFQISEIEKGIYAGVLGSLYMRLYYLHS